MIAGSAAIIFSAFCASMGLEGIKLLLLGAGETHHSGSAPDRSRPSPESPWLREEWSVVVIEIGSFDIEEWLKSGTVSVFFGTVFT